MFNLQLGSAGGEHIEMNIILPSHADYDEAWIKVPTILEIGAFGGSIAPMFEVSDFTRFLPELQRVYKTLSGQAILDSRERQLYFTVAGNGRGGLVVEGYAYSQATYGTKLQFEYALDQTFLVAPLGILHQLTEEWKKVISYL